MNGWSVTRWVEALYIIFAYEQKGIQTMLFEYLYTKNVILWDEMVNNFGNVFRYISETPYHDKKGKLPDGVVLTLNILQDKGDYGINKDTGRPNPTNLGQNFQAIVLNGKKYTDLNNGDLVTLVDFDEENSYYYNYSLSLKFKDVKKVSQSTTPQQPRTTLNKGA